MPRWLQVRIAPTDDDLGVIKAANYVSVYDGDTLLGYLATVSVVTETRAQRIGLITLELPAERIDGARSMLPPWEAK